MIELDTNHISIDFNEKVLELALSLRSIDDSNGSLELFLTCIQSKLDLNIFYYSRANHQIYSYYDSDIQKSELDKSISSSLFKYLKDRPYTPIDNTSRLNAKLAGQYGTNLELYIFSAGSEGLLLLGTHHQCNQDQLERLFFLFEILDAKYSSLAKVSDLNLEKRRLNQLVDLSLSGLITIRNDKVIYMNSTALELFGYRENEIIGKNPYIFLEKKSAENTKKKLQKLSSSNASLDLDVIIVAKNGRLKPVFAKIKYVHEKLSDEHFYHMVLVDNSEKEDTMVDLSSTTGMFNVLMHYSPSNIMLYDTHKKLALFNEGSKIAFRDSFDIELEVGLKVFDFMPKDRKEKYLAIFDRCLKGETISFDYESPDNRARKAYAIITFAPIIGPANKVIGILSMAKQITEQKVIELDLRSKNAMLELILNTSAKSILALDSDYNIISINESGKNEYEKIMRVKLNEGDNIKDKLSKKNFSEWYTRFIQPLKNKSFVHIEIKDETDEKESINETYVHQIKDETGDHLGYLFSIRDITHLHKNAKELEHSKATLQAVLDASPDEIYAVDKDLTLIVANNSALKTFSSLLNAKIDVGTNLSDVVPTKLLKRWNKEFFQRSFNGESFDFQNLQEIDDVERFVDNTYAPVKNEEGEIIACLEVSRDVTEVKRKELELKASEEKYRLLVETSPTGMAMISFTGENLHVSDRNAEIHGFKPEERIGKSIFDLIVPRDHQKIKGFIKKLGQSRESHNVVLESTRKDGRHIWLDGYGKAIRDENDKPYAILYVFNDVTERIIAERAVIESEKKYKEIIEDSPFGTIQINNIGEINFVSKQAAKILGRSKKELLNSSVYNYGGAEFHSQITKYKNQLIEGKETVDFSISVLSKKDEEIFLEGYAKLNVNMDEIESFSFFVVFNNVTDKNKAVTELQSTQIYYSNMYENMFDPIIVYDFNKEQIIDVNRASCKLLGKPKRLVKELKWSDFIPSTSKLYPEMNLRSNQEEQKRKIIELQSFSYTGVILGKGHKELLAKINIIPTYRKKGEAFIIIHDVTHEIVANWELQKINKEIEEQFAIYDALVSNSFDGIDIIELQNLEGIKGDFEGKLIVRNDRMTNFLNSHEKLYISPKEINEISSLSGNYKGHLVRNMDILLQNGKVRHDCIIDAGGESINVIVSKQLIKVNDKTLLIRNYHDITEKVKQQRIIEEQIIDLNEKNDTLEKYIESNLQLENFAYIASHDLKAPLRSVTSFSQLLKNRSYDALDNKSKSFLDIVIQSSENMLDLIEDLLTFSRVNSAKKESTLLDLNSILQRIVLNLNLEIQESNAQLDIVELPIVKADQSMMIQMFQNLLINAIKFRKPDTQPIIKLTYKELDDMWQFSIEDNGIGVSKENSDKIFEIFTKLHSGEIYSGNGLGLTICKKIAGKHGGRIWIDSSIDQGSTIHFTIKK